MKAFLALLKIDLKLASRNRAVLFFNYFFPLTFFFIFAQMFDARQGSAILQVVTMVIVSAFSGTGFSGRACAPCRSARRTCSAVTR